jgi:hypothetical protein
MENPVTVILVPGIIGGALIALVVFLLQRSGRSGPTSADPFNSMVSSSVINVSRIPVAGIGGLGLVAMALAVALFVPRIGQTLGIGVGLGLALAASLILLRRVGGTLPSSGRRPGANTILSIDAVDPPAARRSANSGPSRRAESAAPAV